MSETFTHKPAVATNVLQYLSSTGIIFRPELGDTVISEPGKTDIILIQKTDQGNKKYTPIKIPDTVINESKTKSADEPYENTSVSEEKQNETIESPIITQSELIPDTISEPEPEITIEPETPESADAFIQIPKTIEQATTPEIQTLDTVPNPTTTELNILASLTESKPETKPGESSNLGITNSETVDTHDFWAEKLGFPVETSEPDVITPVIEAIIPENNETIPEQHTESKTISIPVLPNSINLESVTPHTPEKTMEPLETPHTDREPIISEITNPVMKQEQLPVPEAVSVPEQIATELYPFVTSALEQAIRSGIPNKPTTEVQPSPVTEQLPVTPTPEIIMPLAETKEESTESKGFDTTISKTIDPNNLSLDDYQRLFSGYTPNPATSSTPKVDPVSLF